MKMQIVKMVLELFMNIICELIENASKREKEIEDKEQALKDDVALAEKVRDAYPTMSDENIMKQLC